MEKLSAMQLSRRNFLRISAGTLAGLAVLNMPGFSFANAPAIKKVSLQQGLTDPVETARGSALVQNAWEKIQQVAGNLQDEEVRQKIKKILADPAPTFMEQYTTQAHIEKLYHTLFKEGFVDSSKVTPENLFPPLESSNHSPQPFFSAPGSGYNSHHAYPGGLATHTAVNISIVQGICATYQELFGYNAGRETALAGEILHDLAKPWVFQWQEDASPLIEQTIAGTGAHHIFSIAESLYRGINPEVVTAQACAHNHPGTPPDEAQVVNWIKAAAYMAQKNPIQYGLLNSDGLTLPMPHKQAGYIVHLGDHDFVLSGPASQQSVAILKKVAQKEYGMSPSDLAGAPFNKFRNYIGAQFSFMHFHQMLSMGDPYEEAAHIAKKIITL